MRVSLPHQRARAWLVRIVPALFLLSIVLTASACGNDPLQQQATQKQVQFDQLLHHAETIGVPQPLLQPLIKQEQQLKATSTPFSPFNNEPVNTFYHQQISSYTQLQTQLQSTITTATDQYHTQAKNDVQQLKSTLTQKHPQGISIQPINMQYQHLQTALTSAKYPDEYAKISTEARQATKTLEQMSTDAQLLSTFKTTIDQMQSNHMDVSAMQMQYQADQKALAKATTLPALQQFHTTVDGQYQQAVVHLVQAIPYIGSAKLQEYSTQIKFLQANGVDIGGYQKQYDADKRLMDQTHTAQQFVTFSLQVNSDIAAMHNDYLHAQAHSLVQQFHQEVHDWGNAHMYHDDYDNQNYSLLGGYDTQGIGGDLDDQFSAASTPDDYQAVIDSANNDLFNLHMLEADYGDKTPYNQVHTTDTQMLEHYHLQKGQVLVVSMAEQAMRVYQDGKLIQSFLVTMGRVERPSLPGVWSVLDRLSPTEFHSSDPPDSPYWYPPTHINYAILYHDGGYYIHDAWWRQKFGPGTQFPHDDPSEDPIGALNGSHGCVNMQQDDAGWVFSHTTMDTSIVIY